MWALAEGKSGASLGAHSDFVDWHARWQGSGRAKGEWDHVKPAVVQGKRLMEAMISEAVAGDMQLFHALHEALKAPFSHCDTPRFIAAPDPQEVVTQTFCGT